MCILLINKHSVTISCCLYYWRVSLMLLEINPLPQGHRKNLLLVLSLTPFFPPLFHASILLPLILNVHHSPLQKAHQCLTHSYATIFLEHFLLLRAVPLFLKWAPCFLEHTFQKVLPTPDTFIWEHICRPGIPLCLERNGQVCVSVCSFWEPIVVGFCDL